MHYSEPNHGRLERRKVVRAGVTHENIGLSGCWHVVAVRREVLDLCNKDAEQTVEVGYYSSSVREKERDEEEVSRIIHNHWSAIENGTHYRRVLTLGEDGCRVKDRIAGEVSASFRNFANGVYELEKERKRTKVETLKSWLEQ